MKQIKELTSEEVSILLHNLQEKMVQAVDGDELRLLEMLHDHFLAFYEIQKGGEG